MDKRQVVAVLESCMKDPAWILTHYAEVESARDYVQSMIRTETNKASGAKEIAAVANAIIKDAGKGYNRMIHGATEIDGITYCCNGHVLMAIDKPIELPMAANCTLEYDKKFINPIKESGVLDNDMVVEFPSYAELKAETDKLKAQAKVDGYGKLKSNHFLYTFDNGLILNTQYMIWAVKATGATTAHINWTINQGVVIQGNGCTFLLLAIYDSSPEVQKPGYHFRHC